MSFLTLYLLLLKATLTSFSGLTSLPVVHRDLVIDRQVLTERQLNTAVAVARATPGPLGLYVVAVGYFVAGAPGAVAGYFAMITPAFVIIGLLRNIGRRAESPAVQRVVRSVILAAAGLILAATVPLARDSLTSPGTVAVAVVSMALLAFTRVDTLWIVAGAAAAGVLGWV